MVDAKEIVGEKVYCFVLILSEELECLEKTHEHLQ